MPYPGGNIIRVSPTLDAAAYDATGDILFNPTEIPGAVSNRGGASVLQAMYLVDYEDIAGTVDFQMVFHEKTAADFGTINATAGISVSNLKSSKILGFTYFDMSAASTGAIVDNCRIHKAIHPMGDDNGSPSPLMMLKADGGSTSVYVTGLIHNLASGTPDFDTGDIELIFHIRYLD